VPKRDPHTETSIEQPPSFELVLAAVERAARHRARETDEVPGWAVLEHLGLGRRSPDARRVRTQLAVLETEGSLRRSRRHGVPMWALASPGRRRLRMARGAGEVPALPEAPQHRAWRNAHTTAAQEIERFRRNLREGIDEAAQLLDCEPPAGSDAWFALAERLQQAAWRVGSASYCLREWVEPRDERADVDEHRQPSDKRLDEAERARLRARRLGRRNVRLWEDAAGG
jgi:hypothetical protein